MRNNCLVWPILDQDFRRKCHSKIFLFLALVVVLFCGAKPYGKFSLDLFKEHLC